MNTTDPIHSAIADLLTPIEQSLISGAGGRRQASRAAERLREAVGSLEDAAGDDWSQCGRTLASLLDIVGCFADGSDSLDDGAAEQIMEFVRCSIPRLRDVLTGETYSDEGLAAEMVDEARARWGEYLTLVEGDGFALSSELDTNVAGDGNPAIDSSDATYATPAEQVELILSAVEELSKGGRSSGAASTSDSPRSPADSPARPDRIPDPGSRAGGPSPPPAPQAISLSETLREAYLEDAEHCLSSMERAVMAFENDADGQPPIDQLCRDLHTLKGASASIGLSELATYLHEIEEWLPAADIGEGSVRLQPILDCVDFVRLQIAALRHPNRAASEQTPPAPRADVSPVAERSSAPGEETIRVRSTQLDHMMNLLVELVIWRRRRDRRVAELAESGDELSRCVRRLEALAKGYAVSGSSSGSNRSALSDSAGEGAGASARFLSEITNDLREIAGTLRDCRQSMADENRAVSQFIQQFRQQLAQARRVPLSGLFQRLQRVVHEAARLEGKQVRLEFIGQNTGLERSLQERLYEPLLHLVRNAVCHGIEPQTKRRQRGKDSVGTITLEASGNSQMLLLDVRDDGGGLDLDAIRRRGIERGLLRPDEAASPRELSRLIFHPGFSTRTEANEVAGRGVGMDVVLTALNRCHCQIDVHSETGVGTTFRLSIPLPSVIEHSLVFRCGGQLFGLPMQFVMSTSQSGLPDGIVDEPGRDRVVDLRRLLRLDGPAAHAAQRTLVLGSHLPPHASSAGRQSSSVMPEHEQRREFVVEDILGPEEVVVRPLPQILRRHPLLSGVTLSGSGEVVLLLDGPGLVRAAGCSTPDPSAALAGQTADNARRQASSRSRPRVLVAEDSLSARRRLVEKLLPHGFEVTEASDGMAALNLTRAATFDAVFSDLEMPGLSGFELLTAVKNDPRATHKPVVIVTSRDEPETRAKARELGADAFLAKPVSDAMIEAVLRQLAITSEK